jgi:hypothetical protein
MFCQGAKVVILLIVMFYCIVSMFNPSEVEKPETSFNLSLASLGGAELGK